MVQSQAFDIRIKGTPISRGIAIGPLFFFTYFDDAVPDHAIGEEEVDREIGRYREAIRQCEAEIQQLIQQLQNERLFDALPILEAHMAVLQDPIITHQVEEQVKRSLKNVEYVFQQIIKGYQIKFQKVTDPFFQERLKDVQDIYRRVMAFLRNTVQISFADVPQGAVVVMRELLTSKSAEANSQQIGAFVTEVGGETSHAAIVARAKGIPYVSGIDLVHFKHPKRTLVIVDGRTGEVILNPSGETLAEYEKLRLDLSAHQGRLSALSALKAETIDGYMVSLSANIDMNHEVEALHKQGGEGIGLFRSEYLLLTAESFPGEEEQYTIYADLVKRSRGLPVVIRTFDVGGDKPVKSVPATGSFLGCRALRFLLKERELFKQQLRAIWRASSSGNVRILFPMVSSLSELRAAKALLQETREELISEGLPVAEHLPVGCMIEVPSAAIIADLFAKECDFLSIGTNDLVQYALAVDREHQSATDLYAPTDPCVIRLIKHVVAAGNARGIPVSICGEIAGDPRFTPLLLGLGVQELSVASRHIPLIKNAIRSIRIVEAHQLAMEAEELSTAAEIAALLAKQYASIAPDDCVFNCD